MFDKATLDILCMNADRIVTTNRKCLQEYVAAHIDTKGRPTVIVQGTVRKLVWKSLGAGLYNIWSESL